MVKDLIFPGIVVGLLADAVKLTVNYILYLMNFTSVVFWQITATRFLEKADLFKPSAFFIGGVADITVSAMFGILFLYILYILGKKYLLIKGIGFGLLIWVGIFGTLLGQSVQQKIPQTTSGIVVTIVAHLFFGLSLALFTEWLGYTGYINRAKV